MKGLREKFRKHEGFTLVEMLIVVAIIAILIAVSIPLVSSSVEKAKEATDDANLRAAAAVANIVYLTDKDKTNVDGKFYAVDEANGSQGSLVAGTSTNPAPYQAKAKKNASAKFIKVTCTDEGKITVAWVASTS